MPSARWPRSSASRDSPTTSSRGSHRARISIAWSPARIGTATDASMPCPSSSDQASVTVSYGILSSSRAFAVSIAWTASATRSSGIRRRTFTPRSAASTSHEDAVLNEKARASPAMDGSARHGSGRLDKRHFSSGTVDEAAQLVHPIVEEFDALLRRSILAIDKGEEAVLLESVGVFGGPLNRHSEPFPDRAESGVVARRRSEERRVGKECRS